MKEIKENKKKQIQQEEETSGLRCPGEEPCRDGEGGGARGEGRAGKKQRPGEEQAGSVRGSKDVSDHVRM